MQHLDAAQSASGCIAHLDAGPFSGIFLHWHLDASLPCGIGIEMQALFLASQFKMLHCVRSGDQGALAARDHPAQVPVRARRAPCRLRHNTDEWLHREILGCRARGQAATGAARTDKSNKNCSESALL